MKKVAVTGLHGVLGRYLLPVLTQQYQVIDLYHSHPTTGLNIIANLKCDLLNSAAVMTALDKAQPDAIIHLAAMTHIDACQQDAIHGEKGIVWQTNVEGTHALTNWTAKHDKQFIFLSTEAVFSGNLPSYTELSPPNPRSWYGKSKAAAESQIQAALTNWSIVRAVVAYHTDDNPRHFFGTFKKLLAEGKPFKAVTDHYLTPTYIPDVAKTLAAMLDKPKTGVFHATPKQIVTPFEFAQAVARRIGYDVALVEPTTLAAFLGSERAWLRARHACLQSSQTQRELELSFTDLDQALSTV